MQGFYKITKAIKNYLEVNPNINTVKLGQLNEVDLNKQTIYPLAQIVMGDVSFDNGTMSFNINIIAVDSVYQPNKDEADLFEGRDNKQDVYNTMLSVINGLQDSLNRGALYQAYFKLNGTASATPIEVAYGNLLAGWSLSVDVIMPTDVNDCNLIIELPDFPDYDISAFMQKSLYDTNNNGIVDNSEKLGGNLPSYYAIATDITGFTESISTLNNALTSHTGDTTIHFTKGSINLSDLASTGHTHNLSLLNNDIGFITGYTDTNDNIYVTGSTFNTGNGVLTFSNISGGTFTVDLDGRYLTGYTETSNTDDYVSSAAFNTTNGILTLTRISGGTVTVDLDDRYSLTGHTHTASQITDFSDAVTGNTAVLANTDKISYTDATLVANTASGLVSHTGDTSIHFTKGSINLSDLGATGHTHSEYTLNAVLNSHTGDTSIHYTKGSINLSDLGSSAHTHTVSNISDFPTNVSSFTNDSGYITGFTDTNNNDYVTSGAFDTGNGNLTLTRVSGGTVVTNLDNRYSLTGHTHSIYALDSEFTSHTGDTSIHYAKNTINLSELGSSAHTHAISELSDFPTNVSSFTNDAGYLTGYTDTNVYLTGATVTGTTTKSINLFQSDGSLVQASFTDLQGSGGGGDTITGVTFNTSTGDLDLVSTGSTITANLDGRYSLTGHTHSEYTLDSIFNSHTGDTSIHFTKGSINLSDLGSSAHTHTISNITDFPTNVSYFTNDSGYLTGYTDTNEYITDGTFNTSTGNLDLITNSGTTITANLDGRYLDLSAATTIVETLVATGGETQWVLSSTPSSGYSRTLFNENIYLVENVDWSLSGNTIIFSGSSSPLISGDVITFYYHDVSAPLAQLNTYGRVFEDSALSGTTDIDWGSYETFVYTLSGATVFSDINLPSNGKSKTITVYMTGNFAPTYPSGWSTYINGTYNGLVLNTIVVEYVASSTPFYKVMITQPD